MKEVTTCPMLRHYILPLLIRNVNALCTAHVTDRQILYSTLVFREVSASEIICLLVFKQHCTLTGKSNTTSAQNKYQNLHSCYGSFQ